MIELPYPPAILNPNRPAHWAKKSKAKKNYKQACKVLALGKPPMIRFSMVFHPPNNIRRDVDNAIASMKSGIDGLAEAWGIDDSQFEILFPRKFSEVVKGGKVVIEVLR